jgi:ribulose-phosphate 3-epimerase
MCAKPDILLEPFAQAGADRMTIHVELGAQVVPLIWKIRSLGKQVGLAINPPTSMSALGAAFGAGGFGADHDRQSRIRRAGIHHRMFDKNPASRRLAGQTRFEIPHRRRWRHPFRNTAASCAAAGADTFISGTGLFEHKNLKAAVAKMRKRRRPPF